MGSRHQPLSPSSREPSGLRCRSLSWQAPGGGASPVGIGESGVVSSCLGVGSLRCLGDLPFRRLVIGLSTPRSSSYLPRYAPCFFSVRSCSFVPRPPGTSMPTFLDRGRAMPSTPTPVWTMPFPRAQRSPGMRWSFSLERTLLKPSTLGARTSPFVPSVGPR